MHFSNFITKLGNLFLFGLPVYRQSICPIPSTLLVVLAAGNKKLRGKRIGPLDTTGGPK